MSEWQKRVIIFYALPVRICFWLILKFDKNAKSAPIYKVIEKNPLYSVAAACVVAYPMLALITGMFWVTSIGFFALILNAVIG